MSSNWLKVGDTYYSHSCVYPMVNAWFNNPDRIRLNVISVAPNGGAIACVRNEKVFQLARGVTTPEIQFFTAGGKPLGSAHWPHVGLVTMGWNVNNELCCVFSDGILRRYSVLGEDLGSFLIHDEIRSDGGIISASIYPRGIAYVTNKFKVGINYSLTKRFPAPGMPLAVPGLKEPPLAILAAPKPPSFHKSSARVSNPFMKFMMPDFHVSVDSSHSHDVRILLCIDNTAALMSQSRGNPASIPGLIMVSPPPPLLKSSSELSSSSLSARSQPLIEEFCFNQTIHRICLSRTGRQLATYNSVNHKACIYSMTSTNDSNLNSSSSSFSPSSFFKNPVETCSIAPGALQGLSTKVRGFCWIGDDALAVVFTPANPPASPTPTPSTVFIGGFGNNWKKIILPSIPCLVAEVDSLRIITSVQHSLVRRINSATEMVFAPGSCSPAALLKFSIERLESGHGLGASESTLKALENDIPSALITLLNAAHFLSTSDLHACNQLLRTAAFAKRLPSISSSQNYNVSGDNGNANLSKSDGNLSITTNNLANNLTNWSSNNNSNSTGAVSTLQHNDHSSLSTHQIITAFPTLLQTIVRDCRIISTLSDATIQIPLTNTQLYDLGLDRAISILNSRRFYRISVTLTAFTGLPMASVLQRWAEDKIRFGEEQDPELCALILNRFISNDCLGLNFVKPALIAASVGRTKLASQLTALERDFNLKVSTFLTLNDITSAAIAAVESKQPEQLAFAAPSMLRLLQKSVEVNGGTGREVSQVEIVGDAGIILMNLKRSFRAMGLIMELCRKWIAGSAGREMTEVLLSASRLPFSALIDVLAHSSFRSPGSALWRDVNANLNACQIACVGELVREDIPLLSNDGKKIICSLSNPVTIARDLWMVKSCRKNIQRACGYITEVMSNNSSNTNTKDSVMQPYVQGLDSLLNESRDLLEEQIELDRRAREEQWKHVPGYSSVCEHSVTFKGMSLVDTVSRLIGGFRRLHEAEQLSNRFKLSEKRLTRIKLMAFICSGQVKDATALVESFGTKPPCDWALIAASVEPFTDMSPAIMELLVKIKEKSALAPQGGWLARFTGAGNAGSASAGANSGAISRDSTASNSGGGVNAGQVGNNQGNGDGLFKTIGGLLGRR